MKRKKINILSIGVFALSCLFSFTFNAYAADILLEKSNFWNLDSHHSSCSSSNTNVVTTKNLYFLFVFHSGVRIQSQNAGSATVTCSMIDGTKKNYSVEVYDPNSSSSSTQTGTEGESHNRPSSSVGEPIKKPILPTDSISGGSSLSITDEALVIDAPTKYTENGYCLDYVVKLDGSYSIANSITGVNTYKDYRTVSNCIDDGVSSYDTFCLDPAVIGPDSGGWNYTFDEYVDMNSDYGKALYLLYTKYYNKQYNNPNVNFEMMQAARLLAAHYNGNNAFIGLQTGPYKAHAQAYLNAGLSGIANSIVEDVNKGLVNPHTVEVNLDKISSNITGDTFTAQFNLNLSGVSDNVILNNDSLSVEVTNTAGEILNTSFSADFGSNSGSNRTIKLTVTGNTNGSCTANVKVKVKYDDPYDIKNIAILKPTKRANAQRMLVFFKGNVVVGDSNTITLSDDGKCGTNGCVTSSGFTCGVGVTNVVEGVEENSGETVNWDKCVFGSDDNNAKDPAGNTFTVQEKNNYCRVVCKEDYSFKFPGDLGRIAQGRYISINVDNVYHAVTGVASQRTCVTSEIDTDKYLKDASAAKRSMLENLNNYNRKKAIDSALSQAQAKDPNVQTIIVSYNVYKFDTNKTDDASIIAAKVVLDENNSKNNASINVSDINSIDTDYAKNYNDAVNKFNSYTKDITSCTTWDSEYNFNPEITFDYEEKDYIQMMQGNTKLQMIDKENVKEDETKYYCTTKNTATDKIVNCSTEMTANNAYVLGSIDNPTAGTNSTYNKVYRYGVINKYGDPGITITGATTNQKYIYFKSSVPFYTYPNKGIVTTKNDGKNTTLLDVDDPAKQNKEADGLVYPVSIQTDEGVYNYTLTYKNIGQFNTNSTLGRIMGDKGYLDGETNNEYVCTYEVCNPFNDPTCPDNKNENKTCQDIINSQVCNYGNTKDMDPQEYADNCAKALLEKECCDYVNVTLQTADAYNAVCPKQSLCVGFNIVSTSTENTTYINDNGNLQFVVRSVSLDNLFPNGADKAGVNWQGTTSGAEADGVSSDLASVISAIESKGESIYGEEPEYKVVLTPVCMSKINEYNKEQEKNDLGYGDYTLITSNNNTKEVSTFLQKLKDAGCEVIEGGKN